MYWVSNMWNNVVVKKLNTDRNPDLCKFYSNLRWMLCPALHLNPLWCFLYQAYFWSGNSVTISYYFQLHFMSNYFMCFFFSFLIVYSMIYPLFFYNLSPSLCFITPSNPISSPENIIKYQLRIFLITPKHLKNLFSTCTCYNCPRIFLIK